MSKKQEPIGFNGLTEAETNATASVMGLVNTSPPQRPATPLREWVGLTYEEQEEIVSSAHSLRDAINRTDWKLKEKNT